MDLDFDIPEVLMKIRDYCSNTSCDKCTFHMDIEDTGTGDYGCQFLLLANLLNTEPQNWDMFKIRKLIYFNTLK